MPLEDLVRWADAAGIELHGIRPHAFPGKGTGVIATRDIKKGEVVLSAPTEAIHCLDTIPTSVRSRLEEAAQGASTSRLSLHGLLAAALFLDDDQGHVKAKGSTAFDKTAWASCAPTIGSFRDGLPLLWPEAVQELVPDPVAVIVQKQMRKLDSDWAVVQDILTSSQSTLPQAGAGSHDLRDQYTHAWLLINSRTFYNLTASTERYPHDERLALIPLADLFNHAPSPGTISKPGRGPMSVSFSEEGYTITARRPVAAGEEVCISYGEHSNDFLLAEYGFFFASSEPGSEHNGGNPYDSISLGDAIAPLLTAAQKASVVQAFRQMTAASDEDADEADSNGAGTLVGCVISLAEGKGTKIMLSPRVQVALSVLLDKNTDVASAGWAPCRITDNDLVRLLHRLLESMQGFSRKNVETLRVLADENGETSSSASLLMRRWQQIDKTATICLGMLPG
ncbi:hypothetical protein Micbo1qcDRAFT_233217 [Microdochium bolleyi]|uniref:SET domain-containing protein n=1 Tax=Microdochium bolleyi TaxID=196109 RepID=A0A136J406_9PEZI|nr:hypothetical protein Micbo1qcDRAFT_233217 [Microdochium bolleyi]